MYLCLYLCVYVCIYVCMCVYECMYVYVCMYVRVCVCVCVCVHKIKPIVKFRHFLRTVEECTGIYLVIEETQSFKKFSNFFCAVLHERNICTHKMGLIIS